MQRWLRQAVALSIQSVDVNRFRISAAASNSMAPYLQVQPAPCLHTRVHNVKVDASDACEWGLARCGHHPFSDGRSHRHRSQAGLVCPLCNSADGNLQHVLLFCPGVAALRLSWAHRVGYPPDSTPSSISSWLFNPQHIWSTPSSVAAHVEFVASWCRIFRIGLAGD